MTDSLDYTAVKTISEFHKDDSFVRLIRGPIGSGSSTGCCWEIFAKAMQQREFNGKRTSRWGIVRNTYGELRTTTIETWNDWFGDFTNIVYGHPITGLFTMLLPDGTEMVCHLVFLALDRPKDIRKLKSLEFTGIWFNEVSEIHYDHVSMGTGRVNRYPAKKRGGFNWSGIICDTNSCDKDSWYYEMDMGKHEAWQQSDENGGWKFFTQPGALINTGDDQNPCFIENPEAENIENHEIGIDYYFKQLPGKPIEWVNVFILNQYGSHTKSSKVYSNYSDLNNTDVEFNPGLAIVWTMDFNYVPLCSAILQEKDGKIYAVDEMVIHGAEAKDSAIEFIERYKDHKRCPVYIYGDADGNKGAKHGLESNYIIIEKLLRDAGFKVYMKVPLANGPIKNGQNSLRAKILDATGKRSFFVNPKKCPTIDRINTIQLKEGSAFQEVRDEQGVQDIGTALRYFVNAKYPVTGPNKTTYQTLRI